MYFHQINAALVGINDLNGNDIIESNVFENQINFQHVVYLFNIKEEHYKIV